VAGAMRGRRAAARRPPAARGPAPMAATFTVFTAAEQLCILL
jgi:hypothetical protein